MIADFGMAKESGGQTHVSTRVMGSMGYLDPAYLETGEDKLAGRQAGRQAGGPLSGRPAGQASSRAGRQAIRCEGEHGSGQRAWCG